MTEKEFVLFGAEVYVSDLVRSRKFYEDFLGFKVIRFDPSHNFVSYEFNNAIYMIEERPELVNPTKGIVLRFLVQDLKAYYDAIVAKGAEIIKPLAVKDYGAARFYIKDPDGYQIKFVSK